MPWIVGIDEAGYGPNLGPFVMSSVACRVPDDLAARDLWKVLKTAVRRHPSDDDGRILIEDSKVVYSPVRGLAGLETGVLASVSPWRNGEQVTLACFVERFCPAHSADLGTETWYSGASLLPVASDAEKLAAAARRFDRCCAKKRVAWGLVRSVVVCPTRFNHLLDHWDTKGAVLGQSLAELVQGNRECADDSEPMSFCVDKHGGRNNYGALLQEALPDGMIVVEREGMAESTYRVLGLSRDIRFNIRPRADAEHFCVALASMVSKYLRELLMREFNDFWRARVPGLKSTAGYPDDAGRFFKQIRPAIEQLGISDATIWRRK
jgi:ribonuclease HII